MAPEQAGWGEGMTIDLKLAAEICQALYLIADRLNEGEEKFVTQTQERFDKYGDRTLLSEKQFKWLVELEEKYL